MNKHFKGNKSYLPTKICTVCGRLITWRKKWKYNWNSISKCSERCRLKK